MPENKYICQRCEGSDEEPEAKPSDSLIDPVEKAYGLLWMVVGDDPKIHEARKALLDQIDRDGQTRGIEYATSKHTTPPIQSVLHKLP